jgi:hypothetical protein
MSTTYTFESWYEEFHNLFTEIDLSDRKEIARAAFDRARKPVWPLSRHLPGFRPLRDGEEWHRTDWTEEMLPQGWRPLLNTEIPREGDEWLLRGAQWRPADHAWRRDDVKAKDATDMSWFRTRRPLPEPAPEPKPVALGPDDVPPGSVISNETIGMAHWKYVEPTQEGMRLVSSGTDECGIGWEEAMIVGWKIHRPGNLDANGKPVWEPCHKLA